MANKDTPELNDKTLSHNETIMVTLDGTSHDIPLVSKDHSCYDLNETNDILTGLLAKYDILSNLSCATDAMNHKSETDSYTLQGIVDLDKEFINDVSETNDTSHKSGTNDNKLKSGTNDNNLKSGTNDNNLKSGSHDKNLKSGTNDNNLKSVTCDNNLKLVSNDSNLKTVSKDNNFKTVSNDNDNSLQLRTSSDYLTSNSIENDSMNNDSDNNSLTRKEIDNKTINELYHIFDTTMKKLRRIWSVPLFIPDAYFDFSNVKPEQKQDLLRKHNHETSVSSNKEMNILLSSDLSTDTDPYIYFPTTKYPLSTNPFSKTNKTWIMLKNHIQASAIKCGFTVAPNGGSRKHIKQEHREFRCSKGRVFKSQSKIATQDKEYRRTNMINDRSLSRGIQGLKQAKRRSHERPTSDPCQFHFVVGYNDKGYHIINGRGCNHHNNHFKSNHTKGHNSTKFIAKKVTQCVQYMNDGYSNNGVIRNVVYKATGRILSYHNITYLCKKLKQDTPEHNELLIESLSSVDQMIDFFKKNDYDYYCLLHTNFTNLDDVSNGVVTETNSNNIIPNFIRHAKNKEKKEIRDYCIKHRDIMDLNSAQHLMIAIAWVLPKEKRLFNLYPEVLFIDITSDTNKEKRPLLTVTAKTALGSMFTIMRAFLPNEKTWIFRWLFSIVIPFSFPKSTLDRVRVIITDGDSQEYTQLDNAIKLHLNQVHRLRCGYHLNKKTWEKNGPAYENYKDLQRKNKCSLQSKIISDWIYSWMKPTCETQLQYLASKYFLMMYLEQDWMIEDCGLEFTEQVKSMIRDYIEPHEEFYVFYKRIDVRHFSEYSNSAHEGTNHGLKYAADGVKPKHLIDKASERLSFQGERTYEKFDSTTTKNQDVYKESWNHLKCSNYLVNRGAALLLQQHECVYNYEYLRISRENFLIRMKPDKRKQVESEVSEFALIRKVTICEGYTKCSCCMFQRDGLPCRHIIFVLYMIFWDISHKDVDVRWWNAFALYAYQSEYDVSNLGYILEKLNEQINHGPKVDISEYDTIPIAQTVSTDWIIDDDEEVYNLNHNIRVTRREIEQRTKYPFGLCMMSQQSQNSDHDENNNVTYLDRNQNAPLTIDEYYERHHKRKGKKQEAYFVLRDTFLESCETLDAMPHDDLFSFAKEFNDLHMKYKKRAFEQSGSRNHGNIVSSAIADSKKRKTHGTKRFKNHK